MFEKEAEEIAKDIYIHHFDDDVDYPDVLKAIAAGVQKGAEFGYNKGFEFGVKSNEKVNQIVANEWHYVKDGDLPKVNELVLIKITGCFVLGWTNGTNWFNDSNNGTIIDRRMVYAWKEIVLPKECE